MKKTMLLLVVFLLFLLSSCFINVTPYYGEIVAFNVFNASYEEIEGSFINDYELYLNQMNTVDTRQKKPLNSPAPISLYYQVELEEAHVDLIFRVTFKIRDGYEFDEIVLDYVTYTVDDIYQIEIENDLVSVDIYIEDVSSEQDIYQLNRIQIKNMNSDHKTLITRKKEGRTYYEGVYLKFQ